MNQVFRQDERVKAFLAEVNEVCRRHGFCIGHEDEHGGFIVHSWDEDLAGWLQTASVERRVYYPKVDCAECRTPLPDGRLQWNGIGGDEIWFCGEACYMAYYERRRPQQEKAGG